MNFAKQNLNLFTVKIFWMLSIATVFFLSLYIYLIVSIVANVIIGDRAEKDILETMASITSLESDYVSLQNRLDISFAKSKGFIEKENEVSFVSLNPRRGLSLRADDEL